MGMSSPQALVLAQSLFQAALEEDTMADVHAYLQPRPGALELRQVAGLGYALPGYSMMLRQYGVPERLLQETNLVSANGTEPLAHRITFPWLSMDGGRVLGIGGRTWLPQDARNKYENTPEPAFQKGRTLFGIAQASAAMHQARWALVVEGPFDVLACWSWGFTNTVAPVGAKLTVDHLIQLTRLVERVVVLFDDDEGGHRGVANAAALAAELPITLSSAVLQGANDPGSATPDQVMAAVAAALPMHK